MHVKFNVKKNVSKLPIKDEAEQHFKHLEFKPVFYRLSCYNFLMVSSIL